ncbi:MAG: RTX toxin, partial [Bacteroidota bacterium]
LSGGVGTNLPAGQAFDLVQDPTNPRRLFTVIANRGVYRSLDFGETWERVSDIFVNAAMTSAGNAELAINPFGNVFVAIVQNRRLAQLYRSDEQQATWVAIDLPTTDEESRVFGIHPGGQGNTHLSLAADPVNSNVCYIGGDRQARNQQDTPEQSYPNSIGSQASTGRLFRVDASLPNGEQARPITDNFTATGTAPHADSRDMDFDANGVLVEGNDGGVYKQTAPQGSEGDWFSLNGNIGVTEIHSADWDAVSKVVVAGLQDNGTTHQMNTGNSTWDNISNADGGEVEIDDRSSENGSTRFTSNQNFRSFRKRVYDPSNQHMSRAAPALIDLMADTILANFDFVNPVELNRADPQRMVISHPNGIYESFDQGETFRWVPGLSLAFCDNP